VPATITLTATGGVISLAELNGLTISAGTGSDDSTVTFTGSVAAINASLQGLKFTPTPGFSGSASVSVTIDEVGIGQNSPTKSVGIYVGGAAVTPTPAAPSTSGRTTASTSEIPSLTGILDQTISSAVTTNSQSSNPTSNSGIFSQETIDTSDTFSSDDVTFAPAPPVAAPGGNSTSTNGGPPPKTAVVAQAKSAGPAPAPGAVRTAPSAASMVPDKLVHTVPDQVFTFLAPQSPMLRIWTRSKPTWPRRNRSRSMRDRQRWSPSAHRPLI
jgi:hypothetical protein